MYTSQHTNKYKQLTSMLTFLSYKQPTQQQCIRGCGYSTLEQTPKELSPIPECFHNIPDPISSKDWLVVNKESRQTYNKWLRGWNDVRQPNTPNIIYLQPIGVFDTALLTNLSLFVSAYYPGILVRIGELITITSTPTTQTISVPKINSRRKDTTNTTRILTWRQRKHGKQYAIEPIIDALHLCKPKDAFCVIGVTMEDLYANIGDTFTVGLANKGAGVALFSFARYNPLFNVPSNISITNTTPTAPNNILLQRSCKVLVHELAHLYGISHCVWYDCCMNGSGNLTEDYRQPLHFCPVCLRKLQYVTGCDLKQRYESLLAFYKQHQFTQEVVWQEQLLKLL